MKLHVAHFFAVLFGALATLFILLSFKTNYWLLVSEACKPLSDGPDTLKQSDVLVKNITFSHEGFMRRCTFNDEMKDNNLWMFWLEKEGMHVKVCTPAYLLPFPIPDETYNTTSYTSAISFFLLVATVMYVIWVEILDVMSLYVDYQKSNRCSDYELNWSYGLSFMFAPVGVFFCLLSGLLFLVIGRTVQHNYL
ncbi:transmembrane protein 182-like isoform X2 [Xyrauchen texanus]|uniref:transmembrane protein 182-like isoform X2 n=1 Tax=Xyrauchen texanus TaxID=154827 RepID=UPI0022425AED|nr:transmembrane protein 182-like isoform X2 [Xyrauchen texanus]